MGMEEQLLLIRNYDLWVNISDEEYEELNLIHHFIEAKKNDYIYFDSHYHNKLYFLKEGFIKIGYIDDSGKFFDKGDYRYITDHPDFRNYRVRFNIKR